MTIPVLVLTAISVLIGLFPEGVIDYLSRIVVKIM